VLAMAPGQVVWAGLVVLSGSEESVGEVEQQRESNRGIFTARVYRWIS
jgi:hypothetical protein